MEVETDVPCPTFHTGEEPVWIIGIAPICFNCGVALVVCDDNFGEAESVDGKVGNVGGFGGVEDGKQLVLGLIDHGRGNGEALAECVDHVGTLVVAMLLDAFDGGLEEDGFFFGGGTVGERLGKVASVGSPWNLFMGSRGGTAATRVARVGTALVGTEVAKAFHDTLGDA